MRFEKKPAAKNPQRRNARSKQPPPRPPAKPLLSTDQWIDLIGYTLIALAALSILSKLSPGGQGDITAWWLEQLTSAFGWGMYLAPLIMGLIGIYLVLRRFGDRFPRLAPVRVVGATLGYITALATLHVVGMISQPDGQLLAQQGGGGGYAGFGIVNALRGAIGDIGAVIVLLVLWVLSFMLISNVSVAQVYDAIQRRLHRQPQLPSTYPPDDVIVPSWDRDRGADRGNDDLVINGLKPKRNGRAQVRPQDDEEEEEQPPARTIKPNQPKPAEPERPLVINQPGGRGKVPLRPPNSTNSQRLPPPRIIGGPEPGKPGQPQPARSTMTPPPAAGPD